MNDNEYWAKFWKLACTTICVLSVSISGCQGTINYQDNTAMQSMVSSGADPQDARCAIKGMGTAECAIRAATKNK